MFYLGLIELIFQSFVTLVIMEFIALGAFVIAVYLKSKIPAQEFNLIILCLIFEFLGLFSYSVTYYYSTSTHINDSSTYFSGLGYFLSITSIMLVTFAIILIDFRGSNSQILELIFYSWIGGVNAVYNGITFHLKLNNGYLQSIYSPLGILFILVFYVFSIYIWVKRFIQIIRVYRVQESGIKALKELLIFIILGSGLIIFYIIVTIFLGIQGDFSFISSGIVTLIGTGLLVKNNAFVFVTDINLDSIIIIEKGSGIRLYSKTFTNDLPNEFQLDNSDFISSIISSINISFSDTIHSHKDLKEMTFANKTIIIYTGDVVRSILIVSSSNLISKGISKYLVKRFEKDYGEFIKEKLSQNEFVSKTTDYREFNGIVTYVRQFLPL